SEGRSASARSLVRGSVFAGRVPPALRRVDRVSTEFAVRSRKWPSDEIATAAGRADLCLSWREGAAGPAPANWLRTRRTVELILRMLVAQATPAHIFYCAGPGMARSRLSGAAGGAGLPDAGADVVVVTPARSERCRDL